MSKNHYTPYDQLIKSRLRTPGQLFISYFLRGLLVVLPVAITVGILSWILKGIGSYLYLDQLSIGVILLYAVITLAAITVIGFFTKGVIAQQIMGFLEGIIEKAPGLNFIFGTTKDMTEAFMGEKRSSPSPWLLKFRRVSTNWIPHSRGHEYGWIASLLRCLLAIQLHAIGRNHCG